MKTDTEKIIVEFREEKNCSQAVLLAYADRFQINAEHAMSISAGFGGGMGRLQRTCGAVSGAYMVIGLYAGTRSLNNTERKENAYAMIRNFTSKFEEEKGTSSCAELLKCDLTSPEGKEYYEDNHLREKVCEKCIRLSIEILDQIIVD